MLRSALVVVSWRDFEAFDRVSCFFDSFCVKSSSAWSRAPNLLFTGLSRFFAAADFCLSCFFACSLADAAY